MPHARTLVTLIALAAAAPALAAAPAATTTAATLITSSSAVLNGTGTPSGEATTGWFRYDPVNPAGGCNDTFGTRLPATSGTDLGTGLTAVPYGITATGLVSGTTYYFCSVVSNGSGKAFGAVLSFTVPGAPVTLTTAATSVTATAATLGGSANPVAAATTGWFRYAASNPGSCSDSFGTRAPTSGGTNVGSGTASVDYSASVTGLSPGNTYWFCAIASNTYGTTFGALQSFTTPALAPGISTSSATSISTTAATLNGQALPNGDGTTGWFRYSATYQSTCNDTFGSRVPASGGTALGSGNSWVAFSQGITGLLPGTTYWYCAIAQNALGTSLGSVYTVSTPAAVPIVTTSAPTSIAPFSAQLYGAANPQGGSTTGWYRISTTSPGSCNDTFGTRVPSSGGAGLGSGNSAMPYPISATGLTPTTTYYYCAIAQNYAGTGLGLVLSFTTPPAAPTVVTSAANAIGGTTATLNGSVNPNGDATTSWFRYDTVSPVGGCNDTFGTRAPVAGTDVGAGLSSVAVSQPLTGLSMGVTYYYCAIATNGVGTTFGSVLNFTTFAPPSVTTNAASSVTNVSATLAGQANPNLDAAVGWFRFSTTNPGTCNDTFGTRTPASGGTNLGAVGYAVNFYGYPTGLAPQTTYYYCAIAQNAEGIAFGAIQSFTTQDVPTVTTVAATGVTSNAATLNSTVDPNGNSTYAYFRYSATDPGACNGSFGTSTGTTYLGSGTTALSSSSGISGLLPGATYYYCVIAYNSWGTSYGAVLSFTTPPSPAQAWTAAASGLTNVSATLNGQGLPNGAATDAWFRYDTVSPAGGCNDGFGTRVPGAGGAALGAGNSWVNTSQPISGLSPGTTYYYCAIAQNVAGTGFGAVSSFTTPNAPTAVTASATSITNNGATLNGSGNPSLASTTGWFRLYAADPGACSDATGSRVPASGGSSLGSGSTTVSYGLATSGLSPATTYWYCAVVQNAYGTALGSVMSFTTAAAPSVTTLAATSVAWSSATLNGSAVPNQGATTGWFRIATVDPGTCSDTFGTRVPASGGSSLGSGTTPVAYSYATGLQPITTYYYCAIASSAYGTSFGAVQSFTTPPGAPIVATSAATSIAATSAQLNGSANPEGDATTGWFRYAATNPGSCSDLFGTRLPAAGGTSLGAGVTGVAYSQPLTGLTTGQTYWFCAIAQNPEGINYGSLYSFVPSGPPTLTTLAATSVTSAAATLNSSVNPQGASTTGYYRYSTTDPGACNTYFGSSTGSYGLGSGASNVGNPISIGGLSPGTTYYYCAIATNGNGTALGAVLNFTTNPNPPSAWTGAVTSLTTTSATLNGQGIAGGAATTGWFRYDTVSPGGGCNDTFGTRAPASGGANLGTGTTWVAYSQPISGLTANTTYYYCALTQNTAGTAFGAVQSFTTPTAPVATTTAASGIGGTAATLNGSGIPNGAAANGWYRIATTDPGTCDDTFGSASPPQSLGSGSVAVSYTYTFSTLSPGTTYYYCAIVSNAYGTAFGAVLSFKTASVPTVTTSAATLVASSTATMNGSAIPNLMSTSGWFRYSTTNPGSCNGTFGSATSSVALGSGTTAQPFSYGLTGLLPGNTYYYCAVAQNGVGTSYGSVLSFTTQPLVPTVSTSSASGVTDSVATFNGSANPNGAATTGYFRYSTTSPGSCNDTFGVRAPATGGSLLAAGNSTVTFSQVAAGLQPATTYYYCAIGNNPAGTGFGTVASFTTLAAPAVSTLAATPVTATTATLNGSVVPNGSASTGWFRIASTDPGACSDTFGSRLPASGGSGLGSGYSSANYSQSISTLSPATTYWFCAIASNSIGTTFGPILTFTTPPAAPTVATIAPTNVAGTTATLNGGANPNGDAATGWFRYATSSPGTCNDTFGTRIPASGGTALGAGTSGAAFSQGITGLVPGATYYFCALAQNGYGLSVGTVVAFVTATPPTVTTAAASAVSGTSATLNGSAVPNAAATTGWFRYDTVDPGACNDSFGTRSPASGGTSLGAGWSAVPYSQPLSGLSTGTTYYYCAIAQNSEGTATGAVLSFTTASAPAVATAAASSVGSTTATLNGSATPNLASTTGWFRYDTVDPGGCNDTFGTRAPASGGSNLGSGSSAVAYTQSLSGLSPGTTYYFCAIGQNSVATATGGVMSFTTQAPPSVVTSAPSPVASTTATLSGSANPNLASTTGWFRYSTTNPGICGDTFGTRAPVSGGTSLGSGGSPVTYSVSLSGLAAATTYYACAIASNSVGTSFGTVQSFTTTAAPIVTASAATSVVGTGATLNGSANPMRDSTTGWFRYSTTNPGTCNDTFGSRVPASGGTALGSGSVAVAYSQTLTGLSPGTTYWFCAIAQNSVGTSVGTPLSLTTTALPVVGTTSASLVTSTSASLGGTANPGLGATTAWFRYDTANPVTCDDSFGTRVPATGGVDVGSGGSAVAYNLTAASLTPGTTYWYCAIAQNQVGTAFGAPVSFTTLAAPTVATSAASSVTSTTAYLNGSADPNLASTTGWFRYSTVDPGACNDTFGTRAPASGGTALGSGGTAVAYSQYVTGLAPGATYYACAIASNSVGTSFGTPVAFTTPAAPAVVTSAPSPVASTTATLNGSANPNLASTTGWFRYSTTNPVTCNDAFGARAPASGGTSLGSGSSAVSYSVSLSGLSAATTYYACAIASNSVGTSFGAPVAFTTTATPVVTTSAATSISSTAATLNGSANPRLDATTGWFRYSTTSPGTCNDTFGTRLPAAGGAALGSGSAAVAYSQGLAGLSPGTTYYFCAIAQNSVGTSFGSPASFTTPAVPAVTTSGASLVTSNSAQLNGSANPMLDATTAWFRYDTANPGACSDSFGTRAPAVGGTSLGSGGTAVAYAQGISGLSPGTTYFACAIAQNSVGTSLGTLVSFTTLAPPTVTTSAPTLVASTTATLGGSANPNLTASTGWFRYSTVDPGSCNDSFGTRAPASGGTSLGSGSTDVAYSQGITGLSPGTTYYVCAIASNSVGTSFGTSVPFTTQAAPTVVTSAPAPVSSTTATLNGSANPNLASARGWFRYSTVNPGVCNDSFGTRVPTVLGTSLGSGNTAVAYAQAVTGLTPATTYYACAIASNSVGTSVGAVLSFTTTAAPIVTTSAATSVARTTATLNGSANPRLDPTAGWFRYATSNPGTCNDTFGTRVPATGGTALGSGSTAVAYSQALTGLSAATTYYYCAVALNTVGTSFGAVLSFTTIEVPTVVTSAASAVASTTATLDGAAFPMFDATTGWFRYDTANPGTCNDSFGTRAPAAGGSSLGSGGVAVAFSQGISGLSPGTTYWYCAIAQNSVGTSVGTPMTFTTTALPTVATSAASGVGSTLATLNGSADPNLASTTGWFRYSTVDPGSCSDSFGTRTPSSGGTNLGSGSSPVAWSQTIFGLTPGTTYFACAIASNSVGTSFGTVQSFTTTAAPTVVTSAATGVASTTATLAGSANPMLDATTGWFRYSSSDPGACSDAFGTRAPAVGGTSLGSGSSGVPFSLPLSGLSPGTTYWYCAIAQNSVGTSFGALYSFTTTAAPTVTTSAATGVGSSGATLNGAANPMLDAATGWFRYDTSNPGTCSDAFGVRTPPTGGTALGAGSSANPFSQAISGLAAGTTYWYCAIAQNSVGTSFGALQSFTTTDAPAVTTSAATTVGGTTATLNGSVNPMLDATTGWFRYDSVDPGSCNGTFGIGVPAGGTALGSGNAPVALSQAITGLSPGTTYWYCAIAQNSVGRSYGTVLSFTTPAAPAVTTAAATAVVSTGATLDGSANPRLASATGWFRYDTVDPGSCSDAFGTRAPAAGGTSLGAGATPVAFSQAIGGLTAGTTYFYCAIASNSVGTSFGAVQSFTTTAAPGVSTLAAVSVTSTGATLEGSANPMFDAATGWFRYSSVDPGGCSDSFGTRAPAVSGAPLGSGNTAVPYSQPLFGLSPGTTYWYCAIASNSVGTSLGALQSFTTTAAPDVITSAATSVTSAGATLNGSANPMLDATTGWFRYDTANPGACSDGFGTRAPAVSGSSLGAGNTSAAFSQAIGGLSAGTTYWYCALASNSVGTSFGAILSFTTPAAPAVTTSTATGVGTTTATLAGSANPNLAATTGWFRYATVNPGACNDSFGTRAPATGGTSLGSGSTSAPFSQPLSGLAPGTTYWYCAIASNSVGTSFGTLLSFTTAASPSVTTSAATLVASTSATLNGSANPNLASTTGWFRYSAANPGACDDAFGLRVPGVGGTNLGSGSSPVAWSQALTGLVPGTTYWYCAIAQNAAGTSFGALLSFTTTAAPAVTTSAATTVASTSATLNGLANPMLDAATGWFRFDAANPGACNDAFGARTPVVGGASLGNGGTPTAWAQAVSGLAPGTTYWYCAIAQNSVGTSFGALQSFTTTATPTVATSPASSVASTSATLNGSANPMLDSTTGWFRLYTSDPGACSDGLGVRFPTVGGTSLGATGTPQPFSFAATGLTPGTAYWYCAVAQNSVGKTLGNVQAFTTTAAPSVLTSPATGVDNSSALLNGSANPNRDATTGWFRYSSADPGTCNDSFGTRTPAVSGSPLGGGSAPVGYSQPLTGLASGTTYWFCAIAQNGVGTSFGTLLSFTTSALPSVTTLAASGVSGSSATLHGSANPNGVATSGWFRYGTTHPGTCSDTFGTRAPSADISLGAGTGEVPFSQQVTGLTAGTTYYYCAIAGSSSGTVYGAVQSFNSAAPFVMTGAASGVTATAATLEGQANANGIATTVWFRYDTSNPGGCSDGFGTRTPASGGTSVVTGTTLASFSQPLSGLVAGTTYWYCAIGQSVAGTAFGTVASFRTLGPPSVTTAPPSGVTSAAATLTGAANPYGDTATGWFRYATTSPGTCNDSFGTRVPATGGTPLGAGSADVTFTQPIAGLTNGTTYYACALASNSWGTAAGQVVSFIAGATPPSVVTQPAIDLASSSATLSGSANPNGGAAGGWFRLSTSAVTACDDTVGIRVPLTGTFPLGAGTSFVPFSASAAGLLPATTYWACAAAAGAGGASFGNVVSFTTTAAPPEVTTLWSDPATGGATLHGSAIPNGAAATGWFRYSATQPAACDDGFGTRFPATGGTDLGAGLAEVQFSQTVQGLAPGTWYWCAIAESAAGTAHGELMTFQVTSTDDGSGGGGGCGCGSGGGTAAEALVVLLVALGLRPRRWAAVRVTSALSPSPAGASSSPRRGAEGRRAS